MSTTCSGFLSSLTAASGCWAVVIDSLWSFTDGPAVGDEMRVRSTPSEKLSSSHASNRAIVFSKLEDRLARQSGKCPATKMFRKLLGLRSQRSIPTLLIGLQPAARLGIRSRQICTVCCHKSFHLVLITQICFLLLAM